MFAQHNGQVCFLSLCAKTTIVQGYPLPKELVVMNGWLGVAAKGPQLKFLPSVLAIFNMQAATQFAIAVSARFSAIIILNDK